MIYPFQNLETQHSSIDSPKKEHHQPEDEEEGSAMLTAPNVIDMSNSRRSTAIVKAKVTFHHSVSVRTHLHINDLSESELKALWYDEDDLAIIRAQCGKSINKIMKENKNLRQHQNTNGDEEAILSCNCRGLEHKTKVGSRVRFEHRLAAWQMVLLEQTRQWEEGTCDEARIAEAYHECANESSRVAHLLALRDQQWVQDHKSDSPVLPHLGKLYCTDARVPRRPKCSCLSSRSRDYCN